MFAGLMPQSWQRPETNSSVASSSNLNWRSGFWKRGLFPLNDLHLPSSDSSWRNNSNATSRATPGMLSVNDIWACESFAGNHVRGDLQKHPKSFSLFGFYTVSNGVSTP